MADTERSRDFWDSMAPTYDRRSAWLERRLLAHGRAWACARARGEVLDLGIGTGVNLAHLPAGTSVTGLDHSAAMLDAARARARESARLITLVEGDAGALPFPDASFDTVVSTYVLCCVPDERAALAEAVRVLRPGGRLLLADHVVSTHGGVRLGQRWLERFTAPSHGERFTRRPLDVIADLPQVEVIESGRRAFGALEWVHAVRG